MFHTDKLRINKFVLACVLGIFSTYICAADDDATAPATPVQLRATQTRKFAKPMDEVASAIKNGGEDMGATCQIYQAPGATASNGSFTRMEGACRMNTKQADTSGATAAAFIPFIGGLVSAGMASVAHDDMMKQVSNIKYEVVALNSKETVVRMRIYNLKGEQITKPDLYSQEFKKVGDALYVQAIELTPAEQN